MSDIRYYIGDEEALEGLSFFEVESMTYTFDWEAEDAFAEHIDEVFDMVSIGNLEYTASKVIRNCDPTAWRCMLSEGIVEVNMDDYDDTGSED